MVSARYGHARCRSRLTLAQPPIPSCGPHSCFQALTHSSPKFQAISAHRLNVVTLNVNSMRKKVSELGVIQEEITTGIAALRAQQERERRLSFQGISQTR